MNQSTLKISTIIIFSIIIIVGILFRLDQFLVQTLIDDEWHAVHKLLNSTPSKIYQTLGHADYSIPLTLFYWLEAQYLGLSELLMRWPMMLIGIATLITFIGYSYKKFSSTHAVIFGSLLALSPVLISYSRMARPYAITLFLAYCSIILFYKYFNSEKKRLLYGIIYCLIAALAIWMHLFIAFFVAAPFFVELAKLILRKSEFKLSKFLNLIYLGIAALTLILILVLPPLIHDFASLAIKSGENIPNLETLVGATYLIFGTHSTVLTFICCLFSIIGLPILIKQSTVALNIVVGLFLTIIVILLTQPAWVHVPITFLRYILPVIPVLLMAATIGFVKSIHSINYYFHSAKLNTPTLFVSFIVFLVCYINTSPLLTRIQSPNTNTQHSLYSIDFRANKNVIEKVLTSYPLSNYWQTLSDSPSTYKVAVAPWFFESFYWDAPRWEKISKQTVVPGYLTGLCVEKRHGEVPNSNRFKFRNISYLADRKDVIERKIDYIVYQKQAKLKVEHLYTNLNNCIGALKEKYGSPIYEDNIIIVFNPQIAKKIQNNDKTQ